MHTTTPSEAAIAPASAFTASCLAVAAVLALAAPALADDGPDNPREVVSVQGNITAGKDGAEHGDGGGVGLRLGAHHSALWGLFAVLEDVGGTYSHVLGRHVGRVFGGAGMGVQLLVVGVYGYGHLGYGWSARDSGLTFDLGAAAKLLVLDGIRPGVHMEYVHIFPDLGMLHAGVHVDFLP